MTTVTRFVGAMGAGAALMYLFDRDRGKQRRVVLRDKLNRTTHQVEREAGKARRDLRNRITGVAAETQRRIFPRSGRHEGDLAERVRAKLGRYVRNPHAIEVSATNGNVTLRGDVLESESHSLLSAVSSIPGVHEVEDQMRTFAEPGENPHLQGHREPTGDQSVWRKTRWTPAVRLLAGVSGGALATYGLVRRGVAGTAASAAGAALLTRATTNRELGSILGMNGVPAVEIQKTVHIHAPVEEVYRFLTNFANLPRFMSHLIEIRELEDGVYHWVAEGPAGVPVSWNARIEKLEENRLVKWKSEKGSAVDSHGTIRFEAEPDGSRVTVRMSYSPPGGIIGHSVAVLLGTDPKREMDEDFVRLKSLLEHGRTRAHGKTVTAEELRTSG